MSIQETHHEGLSILVVDDHPLFIHGLKELLHACDMVRDVHLAYNGNEALDLIRNNKFDIMLLDMRMPEKDGLDTLEALSRLPMIHAPYTIIMSTYSDLHYVKTAYDWGVQGYILKNTSLKELSRAFHLIMEGGCYYSPEITPKIIDSLMLENNNYNEGKMLTRQERKILYYICKQYDNNEIAQELSLSVNTIKRHKQNIKEKIGAVNSAGYVIYALKYNLIELSEL